MSMNKYWYSVDDLESDEEEKKESHPISQEKSVNERDEFFEKFREVDIPPQYVVVSLILESSKMCQLTLPGIPDGRHYFGCKENEKLKSSLAVQEYNGKWFLYSVKPVYLVNDAGQYCNYMELRNQQLIDIKNGGEKCQIFVEYSNKSDFLYHNYRVVSKEINIGRSFLCDIIHKSEHILDKDVRLSYENGQWTIEQLNQNGTVLVNGKKTTEPKLEVGDIVWILGLRIIIGIGFFSINNQNSDIFVKEQNLVKIENAETTSYFEPGDHEASNFEFFNRRPRRRMALNEKQIQIDSPPMTLNGDKIPLMLRMGGTMFSSATSMLSGNPTMMISSVLFPLLNSKFTEKQKKEYEERRVKKYTEYLAQKKQEIEEERIEEERILNHNYPELQKVLMFPEDGKRLWERRKTDDDFLSVRLGNGDVPLYAQYAYARERFSLEKDVMEDKMYELANTKVECRHAPIMNSFVNDYVCGILGSKRLAFSFVKRLVMQIALTHSYDEVKLLFLIDEDSLEEIKFIKYLSHTWNDEKSFRFIATNTNEAYQIGKHLTDVFEEELDKHNSKAVKLEECLKNRPYYFIFALEKKIFDSVEVLKDVMQLDYNIGISILTAFDDLPKECSKIFQLRSNGEHIVTSLRELEQEDVFFKMDVFDHELAKKSMQAISNTNLKVESESAALPKMVTFLEMFGVGNVSHLNSAMRWRENNPSRSLATPVGVGTDGTMFMLDLHQKYHGPHGLIAGTTGSGKSEFIITYILSLAVNYRPEEVAFVLIDYKGGGLTTAFEDEKNHIYLPHLVGSITNLDGAAINRSLISIESEITRRQKLFKEAKSMVDESTLDIYSYQKLYREGAVNKPLPHLFIIADEFAEMKQQQPEFMESLISIARIGRSLGVHLILATQKPSGVVNEQIRSNTKFRVCLKVQDKSDSLDMLKRPEGAEIKETGRFYLQVGYNELFAAGQSAWTGADYQPQEELIVKKDDSVVFLDILGQKLHEEKLIVKKETTGKSELSEIVKYLSELAKAEGITTKKLWAEPLPKLIDSERVIPEKIEDEFPVYLGEIDDPAHQKQYPMIYDFMECKNLLIVGASKTGKTSMVQNILLQLTTRYGADDINYYILDYSSHLMKLFKNVPHCGAVLSEEDTGSVKKLFDLINKLVEERRQLFNELEVDNLKDARKKQKMSLILVVIDNLAGLRDTKEIESFYYNLNTIMKNASNYGVHFIITCTHLNEASSRIRQEIGKSFSFSLKDKYEYQDVLGCKVNYTPPAIPGRGLVKIQEEALEFHAAVFGAEYDQNQKIEQMKERLSKVNLSGVKGKAQKLPSFTQEGTYEEFSGLFEKGRIPLGYTLLDAKPVALPLKQLRTLAVYIGNPKGTISILENLFFRAQLENMDITVLARKKESVFKIESKVHVNPEYIKSVHVVACEQEAIFHANVELLTKMNEDKIHLQNYCKENGLNMKEATQSKDFQKQAYSYLSARIKPRLVLLENVKDICEVSDGDASAAMNGLIMMAPLYNTYIIHCYEPGDGESVEEYAVRRMLSYDNMALLFGGCYDKQGIVDLDDSYSAIQKTIEYNKAVMKYRGNAYELVMPCGQMEEEAVDKDDESIF